MNTARRQLCFIVSALFGAGAFGLAVEKLHGRSSGFIAVNQKNSTVRPNQLLAQLSGGTHEIASQLELVAGFTELAQETIESADLATIKAHLAAVQNANRRAWAALNKMRNQIRGRT